MPAWANGPGKGQHEVRRAEGPIQFRRRTPVGSGLQPLMVPGTVPGPLAQAGMRTGLWPCQNADLCAMISICPRERSWPGWGNRSRRGDEADGSHVSKNPPPHVGGYQPGPLNRCTRSLDAPELVIAKSGHGATLAANGMAGNNGSGDCGRDGDGVRVARFQVPQGRAAV